MSVKYEVGLVYPEPESGREALWGCKWQSLLREYVSQENSDSDRVPAALYSSCRPGGAIYGPRPG